MPRTLDLLRDQRDAARFQGRRGELTTLLDLLAPAPPRPVLHVHGPAGIGKSALLRELVRRAHVAGAAVGVVDGLTALGDLDRVDRTADALPSTGTSLLVIDAAEHLPGLDRHLQHGVLLRASADLRVVVAGRRVPDDSWNAGGWDAMTGTLALGPLADGDADELLRRRGLVAPADRVRATRWARGLPAALAAAADAATGPHAGDDARRDDALLRALVGGELEGADDDLVAVASIAPAVDARLLGAVLPGVDGDAARAWLGSRSFASADGERVAIDPRVRELLAGALTRRRPDREHALRRALADHLHDRAVLGEPWLTGDLAHLARDPEAHALAATGGPSTPGLAGLLHAWIHRELGLEPPGARRDAQAVGADVVRDALRAFHDPLALAASPLGRGTTTAARAASARRVLLDAIDRAFGATQDAELHRAILRRGYVDADGGHARAQVDLHISRSAYFRRLAHATTVVAELIVADRCPGTGRPGAPATPATGAVVAAPVAAATDPVDPHRAGRREMVAA
ncbi:AAA family ATPase [Patulibacter minatonensis]|uniref:AAA family ATPase n=1 Tax=Patulibacter minatonensis TaxID=298163 RepID=UPI00047B006E|nr:AAA family ATPase [Patulibacter minatonensis]